MRQSFSVTDQQVIIPSPPEMSAGHFLRRWPKHYVLTRGWTFRMSRSFFGSRNWREFLTHTSISLRIWCLCSILVSCQTVLRWSWLEVLHVPCRWNSQRGQDCLDTSRIPRDSALLRVPIHSHKGGLRFTTDVHLVLVSIATRLWVQPFTSRVYDCLNHIKNLKMWSHYSLRHHSGYGLRQNIYYKSLT